jgi:hypothetical protein
LDKHAEVWKESKAKPSLHGRPAAAADPRPNSKYTSAHIVVYFFFRVQTLGPLASSNTGSC